MALNWGRHSRVTESTIYDGTNASDIIAYLTSFGYVPTLNPDTTISVLGSSILTLSVTDHLIRDPCLPASPPQKVDDAFFTVCWSDAFNAADQTDVIALGLASVPTLLGGAAANVDVTIRPNYADTNYQATAALSGTVSLLAALSIISVTILNATTVRVRVQNTGLLSLGGASVVVSAIHN